MFGAIFIPCCIVALIGYSLIKKKNAYNSFVDGAKGSFDLALSMFPYLVAILIAIELYNQSGLNKILSQIFAPIFSTVGIPSELAELVIIKNFSGSGSLALLENIFKNYGVDSYISMCACVIMATSEAVFFVSSVYFCKTKIERLRYAIPLALFMNFISAIFSCFICKLFI